MRIHLVARNQNPNRSRLKDSPQRIFEGTPNMKTENNKISAPSAVIEHQIAADIDAQLMEQTVGPINAAEQKQKYSECDLCGRSLEKEYICSIGVAACLCVQCVKRLENIPDGPVRESLWRFINKNVM
jgi:hypothetical protein